MTKPITTNAAPRARLLLPSGRDAATAGLLEVSSELSGVLPNFDQSVGRAELLARWERHIWQGLLAKLDAHERALLGR